MKSVLLIVKIIIAGFIIINALLYFIQERFIFFPEKLPPGYTFSFPQPFREMLFTAPDQKKLHGLLFKAPAARGVIFYLHGNAGSLASWGSIAKTYTDLQYDLFMLDYRGYGKSEGTISSEQQFYSDVQLAYDSLKQLYDENKIIILGYSIGTGAAAKTAAANHPRLLVLQAPYYNLTDLAKQHFKILPPFLLKYKFTTNKFLPHCTMPVIIFHGDRDEVIDYNASLQLQQLFKPSDTLITLKGQRHNGMSDNPDYHLQLAKLLDR